MKKRIQGILLGILLGTAITSSFVFAEQLSKMAEIHYNNIKIFIDGADIVPKDANGKIVEPFIMDGTTYLPVRAVSNAFGKDVEWDGENQCVYVGKKDATKPDNYLQKIQYNDYKEADNSSDFAIINGTVSDHLGNVYTNGLFFYRDYGYGIENDTDEANIHIAYPLNSQYGNLKGKIVLPKKREIASLGGTKDNLHTSATDVWFYGDGKLLHKATYVTSSMPFSFDINVTGVNQLVIKIKTESSGSHIALTDLALYK